MRITLDYSVPCVINHCKIVHVPRYSILGVGRNGTIVPEKAIGWLHLDDTPDITMQGV